MNLNEFLIISCNVRFYMYYCILMFLSNFKKSQNSAFGLRDDFE